MRNRTVPLLAAVLAVGTLAAGAAIVTTAEPALAVCGQTGPCPGPSPTPTIKPPPPPTVVFSTSGLTERDVTLTPGSTSPGIIQIGAKEGFTITATTQVAGATVALAGQDKFTCQAPNGGVTVTYDYVYVPHFTASPKSFDFQPFSCNSGYLLTTGTYRMYAEAEDSSGTVIGTTPAPTYQFT